MTEDWKYDQRRAYLDSVPLAAALAEPDAHPACRALADLATTAIGDKLLKVAIYKRCRVALDPALPAYGLVVPGDRTLDGCPLLILSGDADDWHDDFGVYNVAHELTHVYQMYSGALRGFNMSASYEPLPNEPSLRRLRAHQNMAETILAERTADVVAVCAALQFASDRPQTGLVRILGQAEEIGTVFHEVGAVFKSGHTPVIPPAVFDALLAGENFSDVEWDYYMDYQRYIFEEQERGLLADFNRAALHKVARECAAAHGQMTRKLLERAVLSPSGG